MSDDEFLEGYLDGRDPHNPEPSDNRSHRYRHSFAIGRAEIEGRPLPPAWYSREKAKQAEARDASL